jgi:hypothetical protein
MIQERKMEKLTAPRLLGMVDAVKLQEQDPTSRELSFLERLRLLVDQQWTWRENQALARRLHAAKLKGACVGMDIHSYKAQFSHVRPTPFVCGSAPLDLPLRSVTRATAIR